jgi:hypothetical protein
MDLAAFMLPGVPFTASLCGSLSAGDGLSFYEWKGVSEGPVRRASNYKNLFEDATSGNSRKPSFNLYPQHVSVFSLALLCAVFLARSLLKTGIFPWFCFSFHRRAAAVGAIMFMCVFSPP